MPSNQTEKYQLNLWEKSDQVLMEDFNEDNRKIEGALTGLEASKAKQSDLEALSGRVSTKAEQSALEALSGTVYGLSASKAEQWDLAALTNTVAQLSNQLNAVQASVPRVAAGYYYGDGAASRFIPLDFTPKAVLVMDCMGRTYHSNYFIGGLALANSGLHPDNNASINAVQVAGGGFLVAYTIDTRFYTNAYGTLYYYIAFG